MPALPRILIADDHRMVVRAFSLALQPHFDVVGECYRGDEVMRCLDDTRPDALVLDIGLPGQNGLQLVPLIRERHPAVKILMVTMYSDRVYADLAMAAGAHGFLPKDDGMETLVAALREILAGRRFVSRSVPPHTNRVSLAAAHVGMSRVTPRQQEILVLIGKGWTTAQIATALNLSEHTVSSHRKIIRRTLAIDSDHGLLQYALTVVMGTSGPDGARIAHTSTMS